MITINNDNFKQIVKLGFLHEKSLHVDIKTRTISDIKKELKAINNNEKILKLLSREYVDFKNELPELRCELKEKNYYSENYAREKSNGNFSLKFKMSFFENYVKEYNPELIIEDEDIVTNYEFYKELDIDDNRYSYQMWQTSDESIEYLKKYCDIYNSSSEIIDKVCTLYSQNSEIKLGYLSFGVSLEEIKYHCDFHLRDSEIKEIHCVRDDLFCRDYNLSKYVVFIESIDKHRFAVVLNYNGIKDAIIFDCKSEEIRYIIPLDGADRWKCREYDKSLNEKILNFICEVESYKDIVLE